MKSFKQHLLDVVIQDVYLRRQGITNKNNYEIYEMTQT